MIQLDKKTVAEMNALYNKLEAYRHDLSHLSKSILPATLATIHLHTGARINMDIGVEFLRNIILDNFKKDSQRLFDMGCFVDIDTEFNKIHPND